MIPRMTIDVDPKFPARATFWMPTEDDVADEEGIGYFRNVWTIVDVARTEAGEMVGAEQAAIRALEAVAEDEESFERLAAVLEWHNPDFPSEDPEDEGVFEQLTPHAADIDRISLAGLEIGVAGLSYALASIGCVPAASCRGHVGDHAWAERPVVFAAVDRAHAEWLQPLVQRCSCGFDIDATRSEFLLIHAQSITEMTDLAATILREAEHNPPPPLHLRPSPDAVGAPTLPPQIDGQQSLFD